MFEYAPAPESRALVEIKPSYDLFIGGEFVPATGGVFKTVNPATEDVLGQAADGGPEDMDAAIGAARRAFDSTQPAARSPLVTCRWPRLPRRTGDGWC